MEVKYFSNDGNEFSSKTMCEKYEKSIENLKNVPEIRKMEYDGDTVYEILNIEQFYFYIENILNDSTQERADIFRKFYNKFPLFIFLNKFATDISQITQLKDEISYNRKSIKELKENIENCKNKIKELKTLKNKMDEFYQRSDGSRED